MLAEISRHGPRVRTAHETAQVQHQLADQTDEAVQVLEKAEQCRRRAR